MFCEPKISSSNRCLWLFQSSVSTTKLIVSFTLNYVMLTEISTYTNVFVILTQCHALWTKDNVNVTGVCGFSTPVLVQQS